MKTTMMMMMMRRMSEEYKKKKKLSILSDIKFYLIHENPFHVLRNMINFSSFPFIAVMEMFSTLFILTMNDVI
jgi:hypothetical protein